MLLVNIARIPPEGLAVDADLDPTEVHLQGEESFSLLPGGTLRSFLEKGDDDSVHVRGRLAARLGLQCGRCLEPFVFPVEQELDLFYLPHRPDQAEEEEDEVELTDRDMVVAYHRDGQLDLGEALREHFFLGLPMKRLCGEDCRGLCPSCGVNRNRAACQCAPEESLDGRLAPLRKLFDKGSS